MLLSNVERLCLQWDQMDDMTKIRSTQSRQIVSTCNWFKLNSGNVGLISPKVAIVMPLVCVAWNKFTLTSL